MLVRDDGLALSIGSDGPCWHSPDDPQLSINFCVFLQREAQALEWVFNNL